MGFPGPSSIPSIDYVVSDRISGCPSWSFLASEPTAPPEYSMHYDEKLMVLPVSFYVNDMSARIGQVSQTSSLHFSPDDVVLMSFNRFIKVCGLCRSQPPDLP